MRKGTVGIPVISASRQPRPHDYKKNRPAIINEPRTQDKPLVLLDSFRHDSRNKLKPALIKAQYSTQGTARTGEETTNEGIFVKSITDSPGH